ncbi:MAG: penicillin-binding protein 2 [Proteobacteria bacterium]|nr:penicillin-binding protein 2 [Pseudomonadota bacterium]MDA1331495.1 penicillin-binding protein 2 [Pseudomonadota bacterium]
MRAHRYRNSSSVLDEFKFRIRGSIIAMLIMSALLLGRLFYLQIVNTEYYQVRAENNRINATPILPNRGLIYDSKGKVLAKNYSSYALELLLRDNDDPYKVINRLADLIVITREDFRRIEDALSATSRFSNIVIRDDLSEGEVALFTSYAYLFPEIQLSAQLYREYPYGEMTSHLLGHVTRVSEADLQMLEQKGLKTAYTNSDWIGKLGIEAFYENTLRGQLGLNYVEVDSRGTELRLLERQNPISGKSIVLSIDIALQRVAYEAFADQNGALIALDPNDGSVLAFVSKPGYDPSYFVRGFDTTTWQQILDSIDRPLVNRVSSGVYPPASTLKPFLALAGLEENIRTPTWSMWDPGYYSLRGSNYKFRDWQAGGHGQVNLHKAIVESVDTYFYKLADDLGIDMIHQYLTRFGFGAKTGIDLPSESNGIAPSRDWKQRRFGTPWYPGDTISVGIGQGYNLVTPLQLAVATAGIANGHSLIQPMLFKTELNTNHRQDARMISLARARPLNMSSQHVKVLRKAMEDVMRPGGTAGNAAAGATYTMAGKTGTAQVFGLKGADYDESNIKKKLRDHALFIGYAPAEIPKIALAVVVENGGHGGSVAAPIARKVFDAYFKSQP